MPRKRWGAISFGFSRSASLNAGIALILMGEVPHHSNIAACLREIGIQFYNGFPFGCGCLEITCLLRRSRTFCMAGQSIVVGSGGDAQSEQKRENQFHTASLSASPVAQSEDDLYRLPQPHMLKGNNFRVARHSAKDGYTVPERRISGVAAKSFRVWAANCQG